MWQAERPAASMMEERGGAAAFRPLLPPPVRPGPTAAPSSPAPVRQQQLTVPGILHFIQHEWARFEAEKYQWEAERAELQAQVAFLQGERKGQENVKTDLVRRIKMLEYALKQERAKYHMLKFGTELAQGEKKSDLLETVPNGPAEASTLESNQLVWKEGRQLLRQNAGKEMTDRITSSVLEKIPFLRNCEDEDSDEEGDMESQRQHKRHRVKLSAKPLTAEIEDEDEDEDSEDALNEFDFLGTGEDGDESGDTRQSGDEQERRRIKLQGMLADLRDFDGLSSKPSVPSANSNQPRSVHDASGSLGFSSDVFIMDTIGGGEVSLGELADLTVMNENDLSCDLLDGKDAFKKTWNAKFTLRSHYDGIRALVFHHAESALVTASEDGTLKLWNLQKTVTAKKNAALDVEPVYAFRGHRGPVLAVAMGFNSEHCYSGGSDSRICCWKIPNLNLDPYDHYDPGVLTVILEGHTDAVWGLAFNSSTQRLASCSADGTVRIWATGGKASCLGTFNADKEKGIPTSVAFVSVDTDHMVASFHTGDAVVYDLCTASPLLTLGSWGAGGVSPINQLVSHPTEPVTITAHEDRSIRFLDNRTGKVVHSMVAHLDSVTCLAVDPNATFLMSGSHDCSLRLWSLENRTCMQEITAHRRKHEEAIHDVAFHPSKPLIASAGADALAKVFV
ncbi:striatin-4 isoform X2 [Rhinatrema bivittatum]|uniref:striatin-4 isoform X2 n=1 Tax=Rhinatrema bivittatum TaxID=194408 RepID=UPI0011282D10|nr:striatin-4 isoform X2 [Rhinatrema bivittatum]